MGKQSIYEHSMKAPLIFSGPGIPQGNSDALVYLYDIFPTVCEMVGKKVPQGLDAESFWPVVMGKQSQIRETLFTSYKEAQRSVRDKRWKLITYPQINKSQLFDLQNDPDEITNLFDQSTCKAHSDRLLATMKAWQKKVGDTSPLTSTTPQDATFKAPTAAEIKKLKQPRKSNKKKNKKKTS